MTAPTASLRAPLPCEAREEGLGRRGEARDGLGGGGRPPQVERREALDEREQL